MKLGCLSNTVDGSDKTLCLKSDCRCSEWSDVKAKGKG